MTAKSPKMNISLRLGVLLIFALSLLVYANSFTNEFVWDDEFLIQKNPAITSWKLAWVHFAIDLYHSYSNYYRPIQMLSYMTDFSIWRLSPFGYHLTNTLLHILVSVAFLILFRRLGAGTGVSLAAALLFSVHPANTAAVTYISGRADALAALFIALSLLSFHGHFKAVHAKKAIILYWLSVSCALTALLSKETALVIPVALFALKNVYISGEEVGRSRKFLGFHYLSPYFAFFAVYMILRLGALNFQPDILPSFDYGLPARLLTAVKSLGMYIGIIFLPLDLRMERSIRYISSPCDPIFIASVFLIILFVLLTARIRRELRNAYFGLIFFAVFIIPVMNFYPLRNNMAEHWLYIPIFGFLIFITSLASRALRRYPGSGVWLISLFLATLAFFSVRTVLRNREWKDESSIYTHTFEYNPESVKILNNLGNLYHNQGDFGEAIYFHNKALDINPREHKTLYNLARDYDEMGLKAKALLLYEKSVRSRPGFAKAHYGRGKVNESLARYEEAVISYQKAIRCDPSLTKAYIRLGDIFYERQDYYKAVRLFKDATKRNPYSGEAFNYLGNVQFKLGLYQEACTSYQKAVSLAPLKAECHLNLGVTYGELGRYEEAFASIQTAYEIRPRDVDTLINMGVASFYRGREGRARRFWLSALELEPGNEVAARYLKLR